MSESKPSVSVIVLGYNGRRFVDDCLTSVLDQDFERPYEVIFADNGSRDGTADQAAVHGGVKVLRFDQNHGYCRGNNRGAESAAGDMLVFLNQDVVVHRSWLRELVEAAESDDSIKAAQPGMVQSWHRGFAARDRVGRPPEVYYGELGRLGFITYKMVNESDRVIETLSLVGVSLLLKRDVIPHIGGYIFEPDMFMYAEDMDIALRLRNAGFKVVAAPRSVVYHDHHLESSISLHAFVKTSRIIRNRLLALWKNADVWEFMPLALITALGAPLNSREFGLSRSRQMLYAGLLIPPTLVACAWAIVQAPTMHGRRKQVLEGRKRKRGWLLKEMLAGRRS